MNFDLKELYQEVIVDHNKNPRNFHKMEGDCCCVDGFNPLCGDKLTLYLKVDNDHIQEASFVGRGCAISTASASLMTDSLKGLTIAEAKTLFEKFHHMVTSEEGIADSDNLDKLAVLAGVKDFPARVKCATLAWHTLMAALEQKTSEIVTTE